MAINVDELNIRGKYCVLKLTSSASSSSNGVQSEIEVEFKKAIPAIKHFPLNSALCVPSSCSSNDVRAIVAEAISGSSVIQTDELIVCDTIQSLAFDVNNLQYPQIVSV